MIETFGSKYATALNNLSLMFVRVFAGKPELRSEVDIIVADVEEPDSLAAMCKQAVIIVNCVGPVSGHLWLFIFNTKNLLRHMRRTSHCIGILASV